MNVTMSKTRTVEVDIHSSERKKERDECKKQEKRRRQREEESESSDQESSEEEVTDDDMSEEEEATDQDESDEDVSVNSTDILASDPLYFVLSRLFITKDGKNIADVLQEISNKLPNRHP